MAPCLGNNVHILDCLLMLSHPPFRRRPHSDAPDLARFPRFAHTRPFEVLCKMRQNHGHLTERSSVCPTHCLFMTASTLIREEATYYPCLKSTGKRASRPPLFCNDPSSMPPSTRSCICVRLHFPRPRDLSVLSASSRPATCSSFPRSGFTMCTRSTFARPPTFSGTPSPRRCTTRTMCLATRIWSARNAR